MDLLNSNGVIKMIVKLGCWAVARREAGRCRFTAARACERLPAAGVPKPLGFSASEPVGTPDAAGSRSLTALWPNVKRQRPASRL
ncbi:MAG: hypothetical protein LBT22_06980, partial [Peptococcaceae bacterium]|nr:hypothetical protein [Peptococcaceae bacterium]